MKRFFIVCYYGQVNHTFSVPAVNKPMAMNVVARFIREKKNFGDFALVKDDPFGEKPDTNVPVNFSLKHFTPSIEKMILEKF